MPDIKFSILIPAYKKEFLSQAVESCLAQSYSNFEVIILDDASPENILDTIKPFLADSRVRYFRNDLNIGAYNVVNNWNKCLSYSSGEYVICMGDDDRLLPNCLKSYCEIINKYPDLGVYHSLTEIIDESGQVIGRQETRPDFESSLSMIWGRWNGRIQFIGDFCFNSSLLKENGGFFFLPLAWGADDVSAFIASRGNGADLRDGIANTQIPGFQYRRFGSTISSSASNRIKLSSKIAYLKWFRDYFSRIEDDVHFLPLLRKMPDEDVVVPSYYVYQDLSENIFNIFFWLFEGKRLNVGKLMALKQFARVILRRN